MIPLHRNYCLKFCKPFAAILFLLIIACNNNISTSQSSSAKPDKTGPVGNHKDSVTAITPLPFVSKPKDIKDVKSYNSGFYYSFIENNRPVLKLPPIKSAHYVVADKEYNTGLCYNSLESKTIKPTRYKYRLPDYKGFEVYYMTGDAEKTQELAEEFGTACKAAYGNLIVYNPKDQSAQVLTIYYSFYIDSQQERYFYIDKDYTIYMAEESVSEGEEGADDPLPGKVYRAVINDIGKFSISTIFNPY
jgi:hypothetical protein